MNLKTRILWFLAIGSLALTSEVSILWFITEFLSWHYMIGVLLGGSVAITINYFGTRRRAFKSTQDPNIKEFIKYLSSVAFIVFLDVVLMGFFVELIKLKPVPAKFASVPLLAVTSFVIKNKFVFKN